MEIDIQDFITLSAFTGEFGAGLTVITGETGAGKSVLLRALSSVMGGSVQKGWVRRDAEQSVLSARVSVSSQHPVWQRLAEAGLQNHPRQDLCLRRVIKRNGQSKAYVQDRPVSISLLQSLGAELVEIHGQHAHTDLFSPSTHLQRLDEFAGLTDLRREVEACWRTLSAEREALEASRADAETLIQDIEHLSRQSEAISGLAPKPGEWEELEEKLKSLRALRNHADSFRFAEELISGRIESDLISVATRLPRTGSDPAQEDDDAGIAHAVEEALTSVQAAQTLLAQRVEEVAGAAQALEATEQRLWDYRDVARRVGVDAAHLVEAERDLATRLERAESALAALNDEGTLASSEAAFAALADELTKARQSAAAELSEKVEAELRPLKMGHSRFEVAVSATVAGPTGQDDVEFRLSTQADQPTRPIQKSASGGELARIALALKVVLSDGHGERSLVFDEIDQGTGGAVAAAIGERLARLSSCQPVIVVTHSPQVAAHADHHLVVSRQSSGPGDGQTQLRNLDDCSRRDEIARMLAGRTITEEARAAAGRLLGDENKIRGRHSRRRPTRVSA